MRALGLLVLAGCFSATPSDVNGPARCGRPAGLADVTGCALVAGAVTSTRGDPLDGIEGSIRVGETCPCAGVTLQVDERGLFSASVYLQSVSADSARVTVVVQATASRYPRHVTGAPYFDTASVVLRFADVGSAPELSDVRLRIPLP